MKFKINEIAQAVIEWKGTRDIVVGADCVEFTRAGRPHAIRLEASRYAEHRSWCLVTAGLDYPLPSEIGIRISTAREASKC